MTSSRVRESNAIVDGPLATTMVKFAFPLSMAMATNAVYIMTDMYWVGGLGVASVAAVLSSSILTMLAFSLQLGVQTGSTAYISRFVGAEKWPEARHASLQSFALSVCLALFIGLLYVVLCEWLFRFALGQSEQVTNLGVAYLTPWALGMPIVFLQSQFATILQAVGEAQKTTAIFFCSALANMVLDPILIEGWIGPAFGVAGAAYATILSRFLGLCLGYVLLKRKTGSLESLNFQFKLTVPDRQSYDMFKIGIPRIIQFAFVPISRMLLVRLAVSLVLAGDRDAVSAAFTLCLRLEFISFLPIFGLSRASQVFMGQNLGAKKEARARRVGWVAAGLSASYLVLVMGLYLSVPGDLIRPFLKTRQRTVSAVDASAGKELEVREAENEKVVRYGVDYMQTVSWVLVFWGVSFILNASVNGAGDTVFPAIITGVTLLPARFFLAWLLSDHYGLQGIWYAIAITMALAGIVYLAYYQSGRWIRVARERMNTV